MRRREFLGVLGGALVACPLDLGAQQKLWTIGFLGAANAAVASHWFAAFVERLSELGWVENRNISIEVRWAEGRNDRLPELAAELVQRKPDVIVTWATAPSLALKQATSDLPVVFALATDPVGTGLVAGLARPGGNFTGMTGLNLDLIGKRFEILREVVPRLRRLAIMVNANTSDTMAEMRGVAMVAQQLGLDVITLEIRSGQDIAPAFDTLAGHADALFVVGDPLTYTYRSQIITSSLSRRLPSTYAIREFVQAGGLMSYGTNFPALFRRSAELTDKILRGTKPSDIPVEQPTKFDLVLNLATAKALDLFIPPTLLARADEVIE